MDKAQLHDVVSDDVIRTAEGAFLGAHIPSSCVFQMAVFHAVSTGVFLTNRPMRSRSALIGQHAELIEKAFGRSQNRIRR